MHFLTYLGMPVQKFKVKVLLQNKQEFTQSYVKCLTDFYWQCWLVNQINILSIKSEMGAEN